MYILTSDFVCIIFCLAENDLKKGLDNEKKNSNNCFNRLLAFYRKL